MSAGDFKIDASQGQGTCPYLYGNQKPCDQSCTTAHIHVPAIPIDARSIYIPVDDPHWVIVQNLRAAQEGRPAIAADGPRSEWDAPIIVDPQAADYEEILQIVGGI
jgi:hypothetical protein